MAELHSTGTHLPQEVAKCVQAISALPNEWHVYVGWPELDRTRPDLLVVSPAGHLISICATAAGRNALDSFEPAKVIGHDAPLTVRRMYKCVAALRPDALPYSGIQLIVLTNARRTDVEWSFVLQLPPGIRCVDRTEFGAKTLETLIRGVAPTPGSIEQARAHVAAASRIPPELTASRGVEENRRVRFLDPLQEEWLRRYLMPPEDVGQTVRAGHQMLSGPAGSGKTLLLLFRGIHELHQNPKSRTLLLTHNKPLLGDLQLKVRQLSNEHRTPEFDVRQVVSWCISWTTDRREMVTYRDRDELIRLALGGRPSADEINFHGQEFAYIQDHIIETLEGPAGYLDFDRAGRSRPLLERQRRAIWAAFQRYLELLAERGVTDFPSFGLDAYRSVRDGRRQPPVYDLILVDEGQFLPPTLIFILHRAMAEAGRLIIAADPTQGFLQRRNPWVRAGLNFGGRSTVLKRPYRSTSGILGFARAFFLDRTDGSDNADINLPDEREIAQAASGPLPEVISVNLSQDEVPRAVAMIRELISNGVSPSHFLVLVGSTAVKGVINAIGTPGSGQCWGAGNAKEICRADQVRVCSLDAATGLEAPYVIVVGVRQMMERESDPSLGDDRPQLKQDNTRRLYMAATRAGYRLSIIWSGSARHPFPTP